MHTGRNFNLKEALLWTRRDIYLFLLLSSIPTILYVVLKWKWLSIPWLPVSLVGTAVAFIIGFKNNASYDRMWEARKAWGAIVNGSRAWGIMVKDYITNRHAVTKLSEDELKAIHKTFILRHISWLTALRYQLREEKPWENMSLPHNVEYRQFYNIQERDGKLSEELDKYLSKEEKEYILSKKNKPAHIISLQSKHLKQALEKGLIEDFRHMEMERVLVEFYNQQGVSERIKNFPYPRQFSTLNFYFVRLFIIMLPFGMLQEFEKLGNSFIWLTIPFCTLVAWVFNTIERIGESTENPFEGSPNDVPITSMSRNIEIDLLEMLDSEALPESIQAINHILL